MKEILSIAIPTYNRSNYLKELLESIKIQFDINSELEKCTKVYVYNNNSDDDTDEIILNMDLDIIYKKNELNIGGDANIYQAYTKPKGEYIWVIGDDELLPKTAIKNILSLINNYAPSLIIARSDDYNTLCEIPELFKNYIEFSLFAIEKNPHLLIAHSLISANIIRKDCFDAKLAFNKIKTTCYEHFYGIVNGVINNNKDIIFSKEITLNIRSVRLPLRAYDPEKGGVINNLSSYVQKQQIIYLEWLKDLLQLNNFIPKNVCRNYYIKIVIYGLLHSPFKTIKIIIDKILFYIISYLSRKQ